MSLQHEDFALLRDERWSGERRRQACETLEWDKRGRVLTAATAALYVFREEEKDRRQPTRGRERGEGQTTRLFGSTCDTGYRVGRQVVGQLLAPSK